ncbi:MAG: T9SS type A sorting domain-containing protein [Saprospiraceae bacterium]|nr:T9SS type A sorting domain-containing protein [Lewinellaceae bacterium]
MKKLMLLLAVGSLFATGLYAQQVLGVCGNSTEDQRLYEHRLLANIETANAGGVTDRGAVQYVPVYFHLVGDANGEGKVKERLVLDQLCALNEAFSTADIRFYLRAHPTQNTIFNYSINATNVYSNQDSWFTMQSNRHPNALNVYIVDEAVSSNNSPGITLAYYNIPRDWVVSRKDQISGASSNSTLPHEVGHFFSLAHTFLGWESNPFDSTDPTWPIAPSISPGGVPTERMSGSNCSTAADKICDTPPDYNFGLFDNDDCNYDGGAKDPSNVDVVPMENNMMSYFNNCSAYVFTTQQKNVMVADLNSSARNYLDNNYTPPALEINTPTNLLVSPAAGATVPYYDEVLVEWQDLPEATWYLLEFDLVSTYATPFAQSFMVNTNSKLVTTLLPNRTYYWRVRPINEYVTCAAVRQRTLKTTGTSAVRDIEGLTAWQIAPNPVRNGENANLFVQAEEAFDANIRVFTTTGQEILNRSNVHFQNGDNRIELPVTDLRNGLYMVMLQTREGQAVRKLSVLK